MPVTKDYDYDFEDLLEAYSALGVRPGQQVYVSSNLVALMRYREPGREAVLEAHLRALRQLLGPHGSLFVPTASLNLCNTDIVYDPRTTPSRDMGVFSEYVRCQREAVRSFHPFWSIAGIGPQAENMLGDISRHAYGWGSAFQRFVANDVLALNVGVAPPHAVPVIHHIETVVGVPYRYTKEFMHPVRRDGTVEIEPFYLLVLYRQCDIKRDRNQKIFEAARREGLVTEVEVGRGKAWSFSHKRLFDIATRLFRADIYTWLKHPPANRPYQT